MRKLSKKISMLMVLAMLVSLFSGIVSASAASAWSFKSSKYDVAVDETIEMEKNEYADFDLLKNDAAPEGYTVKWSSSNSDVVWVNAKTGQLRADKFKTADYGDKATISATFTNTATKKSATRSFVIVVAEAADYEIAVNFGDEVLAVGQKYDLAAVVKADGKEVKADVAFAIDGKAIDAAYTPAAAGEFTIVTTATVDGKVVAEVKTAVVVVEAGLESAKQISFNTVALTFGSADAAKAVAADASKLNAVWLAGENEINAFVKAAKVDEKKANVVNVELYNNIAKDTTYKFTYADKSATIVGVDLTKYASISIATTAVPACDTETKVKVNFYNAEGILVDVKDTGFTLTADPSADYHVNGTNVYFYDQYNAKSAVVTATYFMGYDDNGNKIADLKATATITSYDATATNASNINGWAVRGTTENHNGAQWGGNSATLAINEGSKKLVFKFTVTDINGTPTDYYNTSTPLYANHGGYEYSTTNEGVILVDTNSGLIFPVAAGSAQIVVKSIASYNPDVKNVIGVFTVNVVDKKLLTSIAPVLNKTKLATTTAAQIADDEQFDTVWLKPQTKDQFGAGFGAEAYKFELVSDVEGVTVEIKTANAVRDGAQGNIIVTPSTWAELEVDPDGAGDIYYPTGSDSNDNSAPYFEIRVKDAESYAKNVQIAITAYQWEPYKEITRVVNVSVKDAGEAATYSLDYLAANKDLNFAGRPSYAGGRWYFESAFKLNAYDSQGYFAGTIECTNGAPETLVDGDFYFEVFKGSDKLTGANNPVAWDAYADIGPAWKFYAMKAANQDDVNKISEFVNLAKGAGTYTIIAYKYNGTTSAGRQVAQKSIVVTDNSSPISVIQKDNKINLSAIAVSGAVVEANLFDVLEEKLTFKRDGKDVAFEIIAVDKTPTEDGKRIYVTNVTVREVLNDTFDVFYNCVETVYYDRQIKGVGKVFEIDLNH